MTIHDAHHAEYLAAAAALCEQTPPPPAATHTYAVGDYLTFRLRGWSDRSHDDGRVISHHKGLLIVETATDIVEVDPRPWPTGNVLPF